MQLVTASLSWAFQQQDIPPKYQYRDPVTSDVLMCDQCPPGTAVKRHCTADIPTECHACPQDHFAESWHWGDSCKYCTSVRRTRSPVTAEKSSFACETHLKSIFCVATYLCVCLCACVTTFCPVKVCKERQLVKHHCNSTHDQLCECAPGFHLVVEFCITHSTCPPGSGVVAPGKIFSRLFIYDVFNYWHSLKKDMCEQII